MLQVIALHGSLSWLVFASTFGAIASTVVNGWLLFREYPWLLPSWHAFRKQSANKILKLGLMFFVLQCAVAVGFASDNVVIAQVLGGAAVAVYAVPQKLFSFVSMLVSIAITPLWPAYGEALARGDVVWVRRAFLASLRLTLATTVPLCTLLAFAGPWILRVAVGRSLHAHASLLAVLAFWGVISAVSATASVLLNGAGVLKVQTIVAVVASLSNLALSILLTRRLGVIGVCLGSILTQLLIAYPALFFLIWNLFSRMDKTRKTNSFRQDAVDSQAAI
jgi:O-antigen/teichoic acid export membrane protein